MKLKIGDRVIYISGNYTAEENNPLVDTEYFCKGTITDYDEDRNMICPYRVDWDNGNVNSYREEDLQLVDVKLTKEKLNNIILNNINNNLI